MSTTIDNKVVEMRFDNKHFEKNVQNTMSTLDKLKQKLNLSGASKGLENINTSAKKVNMDGLANSVQTVHNKFSALDVMGVTALANITNAAVNAGKQIVKSLTVAPVSDGFKEYELMLTSIQTTMAGTGLTAKQVEEELKKLDEYADKTVYSTADMLNNLPKFTNAGVDLSVATKAMIGIANATAHAGGDATKASIAFYNLGQAIGTGYLTRMDYNSINNAGIATMEWKEQMVEAALAAGTLTKAGDGLYKAGNKTLSIQQLFIDGLQEQWATTDVMLKVFGDYGNEMTDIGKRAYASAQDIKTYTMMMESLKATAGTGWKDTWQIIFGSLDEAKEFWTGLTNFISNIITKMADFRNAVLEGALGKTFRHLADTVNSVVDPIKKSAESIKEVTKTAAEYAQVVDDIIAGKWGNAPTRWEDLAAAGYDWAHAQNLVNERLGCTVRHATDYKEAEQGVAKSQEKVAESTNDLLKDLVKLSDAELRAKNFTEEQIKALRELEKIARKTGLSFDFFIDHIDEIDGRWLLINSFKNIGNYLTGTVKAFKQAWKDIFYPNMSDNDIITNMSNKIFNLIAAFHKLTQQIPKLYKVVEDADGNKIVEFTETGDKLIRTFKGVFAILDMVGTIIMGPIKLGFKILSQLLGVIDLDILGFTAIVGDALVGLRDWLDSILDFTAIFKAIIPYLQDGAAAVRDWFKSLKDSEVIVKLTKYLNKAKESIAGWIKGLKEADNIPEYIISGLVNGLKSGASIVVETIIGIGKSLLDSIKKILGIHSPSTEFFEIGQNIIQGLINGISSLLKMAYELVTSVGSKLIEIIRGLDIGSVFTILVGGGFAFAFVKIARAIELLASPLEHMSDLVLEAKKVLKSFRGVLNSLQYTLIAEAIKSMAMSILILVGAIALLTQLDQGKMWSSVGAIAAIMALLAGLIFVTGKFGSDKGLEFGKMAITILALGIAMNLMAAALKKVASVDPNRVGQAIVGFMTLIGSMVAMMAVVSRKGSGFTKLGAAFMGMAAAFLMMSLVVKALGGMDPEKLQQGLETIGKFTFLIVLLMAASKLISGSKNIDKFGSTMAKIGAAILMMALVARMMGGMDPEKLNQGINAIAAFSVIIMGLMLATRLLTGSKNVSKIGGAIAGIAGAFFMMALVTRIVSGMEPQELAKGLGVITVFGLIVAGLMAATRLISGKDLTKVGSTILMISGAIGILAVAAALLSLISVEGLAKGVIAVGFLSAFVAGLIYVTKFAQNCMGTMIALTTAIGILAISVGILSTIDPSRIFGATAALSILLGMLALVVASTSLATGSMATLIAMTVVIGVLGVLLFKLAEFPVERSLGAALGLSTVLMAMSVALMILGAVGMMGPAAFIGIGALATLIVGLGGLIIGIGALMDKFPMLEEFLDKGIPILGKIGTAIGTFFGSIVGGFISGAASGLPALGTALSDFMVNATPFVNGIKQVDANTLKGVGFLAAAVVALTAAKIIESIGSFLSVGSSFSSLGTELSKFMTNATPFIVGSRMINPSIMEGVKTLAEAILILTGADLLDGMKIFGKSSLEKFGSELAGLGTHLNAFATNLGTFDDAKLASITCACKAIKALAEASSVIPNEGGWAAKIIGENSLATFADRLPDLAKNINKFIVNLGTFDDSKVSVVNCACQAIKSLAEAADALPNEGGLWASIVGDNGLSKFASDLPDLAKNLNGFITNLGTFDESKITTVNCACEAIKTLAKAAETIPNEGGLWAAIVGDNGLAKFADKLPDLARNISEFVSELGTFTPEQIDAIESASSAIKAIAKLGEGDIKETSENLKSLGNNMVKFGSKIQLFANNVSEVNGEDIDLAIAHTKDLINMAKSVIKVNSNSLKAFGDSLQSIAKDGVKGYVKAFSGESPKSQAKAAAVTLLKSTINGAKSMKSEVSDSFETVAKAAVKSLNSQTLRDGAKQAGKDFVTGFANGIYSHQYLAINASSALGKEALIAAKAAIDSNSPSKESMKIGNYFGQGFVIGIKDYASKTYDASYSVADRAKEGLRNAISKVSSFISDGVDNQPTIRPVLDLSEVESGAGYLNNMFNNNPSVGVMTNLRAISSGMNARNQNGTNNDVVSAIDKLRNDLGNIGGTTNNYNVNGITYDDGSNIVDAVRTIVRAATIERRI